MKHIFSDCEILSLEKDKYPGVPGVFIKVKKPIVFVENNLSDYKLYSIIAKKRVKDIIDRDFIQNYYKRKRYLLINKLSTTLNNLIKFVMSKI